MTARGAPIRCRARLKRPALPADADWTFLVLPRAASAKLQSRGMVSVDGRLDGQPFQATLQPDGEGGHWLKIDAALCASAGVAVGATVALELTPVAGEPEPVVPDDVHRALAGTPAALATWQDITPLARRDWIHWITSGKKAETRVKRIASACDMLASGKRRACCFDRTGQYSRGNMGVPKAAD